MQIDVTLAQQSIKITSMVTSLIEMKKLSFSCKLHSGSPYITYSETLRRFA